jgi:hypothetical protein
VSLIFPLHIKKIKKEKARNYNRNCIKTFFASCIKKIF